MADVIKFEFDQPVEVALRFPEPKVFPSNFAGGDDRHMYSTTDGRVMYVSPLTSARIKALQLTQGEFFSICKRKDGRLTEFAVSREPIAAGPARPATAPRQPAPFKTNLPTRLYAAAPTREHKPSTELETRLYAHPAVAHEPPSQLEQQLRASIDMVNSRKAGEQGDGTLAVMAPPPRPAAAAAEPRLAPAVAEFSSRLVMETNALVDVYAAALKTASERHGNSVKPDDVRSFVVTAYINASKQGGRNAA
jgi:hypothetical protein